MLTKFQQIWKNKESNLSKYKEGNNLYLATIYGGLADNETLLTIHKEIADVTREMPAIDLPYYKGIEKLAFQIAKIGKKSVHSNALILAKQRDYPIEMAMAICSYQFIKKFQAYQKANKMAYDRAKDIESKEKLALLDEMQQEAEKEQLNKPINDWKDAKIFYLASSHDDCAEDHLDFQGRLYYDRFWRRFVKDATAQAKVLGLISSLGLMSMQWVINSPVWFITRPNCRHYFVKVPIWEVEKYSVAELIDMYGTHSKVGRRGTRQTISHSRKKAWYTKENVEAIIKKYEERLSYLQTMEKKKPNIEIERDISKTKLMIKKWRNYLKSHF